MGVNAGKKVVKSQTITTTLASAGHVLDGADAELVLNPLRLAFETKNIKVIELALDCLHVCTFLYDCTSLLRFGIFAVFCACMYMKGIFAP